MYNTALILSQFCSHLYVMVPYNHYHILTVVSTAISSPTVTHSPVMMGGVNVAAAVAIPVVLILVISVVVGVILCVRYYRNKREGLQLIIII